MLLGNQSHQLFEMMEPDSLGLCEQEGRILKRFLIDYFRLMTIDTPPILLSALSCRFSASLFH